MLEFVKYARSIDIDFCPFPVIDEDQPAVDVKNANLFVHKLTDIWWQAELATDEDGIDASQRSRAQKTMKTVQVQHITDNYTLSSYFLAMGRGKPRNTSYRSVRIYRSSPDA